MHAKRNSPGFTLLELLVTLMVLAVLGAISLPRFIDLGTEARIAVLNQTAGAASTAAETAHLKCLMTSGCYSLNTPYGGQVAIGPEGQTGTMYHGYPTGQSRPPNFFGLKDWLTLSSGMSLVEVTPGQAEIRIADAPDPLNCKVKYSVATSHGLRPTITSDTSGC